MLFSYFYRDVQNDLLHRYCYANPLSSYRVVGDYLHKLRYVHRKHIRIYAKIMKKKKK